MKIEIINNFKKREKQIFWAICTHYIFLFLCIITFNRSALSETPLYVPLTITNQLDIDRIHEPVTTGIPLPMDLNVTDTRNLKVTSSDGLTASHVQFKVLSRWGELSDKTKPIRWVLVDFRADVPAKGKAIYYLTMVESGAENVLRKVNELEGIFVSEDVEKIIVDTGPMKFTIAKDKFNLFDQVIIKDSNSALEKEVVSSSLENGIRINKGEMIYRSSLNQPDSVSIEEKGPLRAVIHIRGKYQNEEGDYFVGGDARQKPNKNGGPKAEGHPLEYNVRIHAYKDKNYVKVFYTLENNGNGWGDYYPSNDAFIDGLYLDLTTNLKEPISFVSQSVTDNLSHSDALNLLQTHSVNSKHDESKNFSYDVIKNGKPLFKGERSEGWIDVSDGNLGVTVGVKHFWQNYPKSIEINGNGISLGLLPDYEQMPEKGHYSEGNFYFSGGWHKTHEVLYYFHDAEKVNAEVEKIINSFKTPLVALAPGTWYADTKAWSLVAPRINNDDSRKYLQHYGMLKDTRLSTESDPVKIQREAIERYERMNQIMIDPDISEDNIDLEKIRESRGSFRNIKGKGWVDYFDEEYYGWEDFGDLVWRWNQGGQHSALHYDWPYIMWLQMIRSGDTKYFEIAEEMTRHSVDMDQIHTETTGLSSRINGLWWSEDIKGHHKSPKGYALIVSHTWNGGYTLGYLLTGNQRYLEAARRSAKVGRNFWFQKMGVGKKSVIYDQTRSQGWSILMLVNLYKITGDIKLLKDAMTIFTNSLLYMEQLSDLPGSNGEGYITLTQPDYKGKVVVTFATYHLEPLCELHYEAKRAGLDVKGLEGFMVRSLNWLKDYAYVGGDRRGDGKYSALTISYSTDPNEPSKNQGGTIAHNIHVAGAFGYGYLMLRKSNPTLAKSYLDFARHLFRDLMFYTQAVSSMTKNDYFNPNIRAPIKYLYFTSATKEMGYIGRGGQFYLNAEYKLQKGEDDDLQIEFDSPFQNPELVWLPQGTDLTKHSMGPFTVRIRLEGTNNKGNISMIPRIRYFIGTGSGYGYFDMIHEGEDLWIFNIPDPNWNRYRSKNLHYQVKVFDDEGNVIKKKQLAKGID